MSIEPMVELVCAVCLNTRQVTRSWQRRRGDTAYTCRFCEVYANIEPDDDSLWFWLEAYGVQRNGITAQEHIRRFGWPDQLRSLLDTIRPLAL